MVSDNTEIMYREKEEFLSTIKDYVTEGSWKNVESKLMYVIPAKKVPASTYSSDLGKIGIFKDTTSNSGSGLYLEYPDEEAELGEDGIIPSKLIAMGKSSVRSLLQRAKIGGTVLGIMNREDFSNVANIALNYSGGMALLRISNGKVRGVLGGSESAYSIIDMYDIFNETEKYLTNNFKKVDFVSGTFSHEISIARFSIRDDEITEAYVKCFKNFTSKIEALITVCSSDTGFSGANIYYSLVVNGKKLYLSTPMKVEHKQGATLKNFTDNLPLILPRIRDKIDKIKALESIDINYPAFCISHLMSKVGLGKKAISEIVEKWKVMFGDDPSNGMELYLAICETPDYMTIKSKRATESAILDVEERVSRILGLDFTEYDYKD